MSFKRLLLAIGFPISVFGAESGPYNEVFDATGAPRPGYSQILPHYEKLSAEDKKRFARDTLKDFRGDNALDPLPRILTESELALLRRGVEQRGTAIRLFLQDYFAGNRSTVETLIPRIVLDRIVDRSQDAAWVGQVDPARIAFPYGPDIIRDPQGAWRVIEDNPGFIGGPGDLIHARETLMRRMPAYRQALQPVNEPEQFYRELVERYRELTNPPDGRIVLYSTPPYPDREDRRIKRIFSELDVDIVGPSTQKRLIVDQAGVWVRDGAGTRRAGFVILNGEHAFVDPSHPAAYERTLVEEARSHLSEEGQSARAKAALSRALAVDPATGKRNPEAIRQALRLSEVSNSLPYYKKVAAKGLNAAILSGKVATNYSPGLDFIGDKEFYVYVDSLVRHYLKDEPILRNIPTQRFGIPDSTGKILADQALLEKVFADPKRYVIKAVDGRGGDAVWVGAKIPAEKFESAKPLILAEPERFIVQEYTPLSIAGDKIVDLRMISAVDSRGVIVSKTPWARALPLDGDGKVNLSSSGREMTVLIVQDPETGCPSLFSGISR